jgi:hypothetical protein
VDASEVFLLPSDETISPIESQTTVVTDDTATRIVVRQPREEAVATEGADLVGIYIEDTIIVGLAVVGEDIGNARVNFETILMDCLLDDLVPTEGLHGTTKDLVSLQTDDNFVILINIAWSESRDTRNRAGIDRAYAMWIFTLFLESLEAVLPDALGLLRRTGEEGGVTIIRGDILRNEVADVEFDFPHARLKLGLFLHNAKEVS